MRIKYSCLSLILLISLCFSAYAQETRTEICVDFRVNSTVIDRNYRNNTQQLTDIIDFLNNINQDSTVTVLDVSFCGSASPEGSYQLNHSLARGRLEALEKVVRSEVEIADSIISRDDSYISWNFLRQQVEASDMPQRQQVLDIIDQEPYLIDYPGDRHIDHRIIALQKLDNGSVWRRLHKLYFEPMRNACVVFVTYKQKPKPGPVVFPPVSVEVNPTMPLVTDSIVIPAKEWVRRMHIKTNAAAWGVILANIGVEVDLAKHFSFALPVYYSALNYFTSTTKFRAFGVQPELRYWPRYDNRGFFVGAHFGMSYFNIAVNGDTRYQDHDGKNPALGGGLSIGYRLPISKNKRWNVEFTIGGGAYSLYYDKFYNVDGGRVYETCRDTYFGIDNVGINFSYSFGLKRRNK